LPDRHAGISTCSATLARTNYTLKEKDMGFSLLPREYQFFDLFDKMADASVDAARLFKQFAVQGTFDEAENEKMRGIEHHCDEITHEIINKLNRTFITPFDREDIYALAHRFDSVVDIIHAITKRMLLYNLHNSINKDLIRFSELIEQSVTALATAVRGLRNLKNAKNISEACIEINRLENLGDHLRDETIGKLFDNSLDPLYIIKWKDIFQDAERALDQCEDVANVIESIMVKQG
jgi:uncharacterized protein